MDSRLRIALALAALAAAPAAFGEVILYADEGFRGPSVTIHRPTEHLRGPGFDHRALSAVVTQDRWEACDQPQFGGRCIVLRPGRYPTLDSLGIGQRIASIRDVAPDARIDDRRYAPMPLAVAPEPARPDYRPDYYRRRGDERIYEVPVNSVHAVVGPPEQRCWVESREVAPPRPNVGGAVAGAIIGGILGHQVGRGGGQDLATAGGAIAGGAIGANAGGSGPVMQDVRRCENVSSGMRPEFWDVIYNFRGIEHRVQMSAPPGPTISVNERGEPRA